MEIPKNGLGIGLRTSHYQEFYQSWPELDFLEIISENYMGPAEMPRTHLARMAERYPIALHGVALNLMGKDPISTQYLDDLAELCHRVKAPYFTDHLCWSRTHSHNFHDLLPTPYTQEWLEYSAERAAYVQNYIGLPFGIENLSSYVSFKESTMSEWEFYAQVVEKSGCHFMLDINNIYVSSQNHDFDPRDYLKAINFNKVLQCHMAGHMRRDDGLIIDTHDHEVCSEVWELYQDAWNLGGPFPTLLEWDDQIPSLDQAVAEVRKALNWRKS